MKNSGSGKVEVNMVSKLPEKLMCKIIGYCPIIDIINNIMKVSKQFWRYSSYPKLMSKVFFNQILLPLKYGSKQFSMLSLNERIKIIRDVFESGTELLPILGYYTDGGVFQNNSKYFISNLYIQNPSELYSTVKSNNVNAKAVSCNEVSKNFILSNEDISKFVISQSKEEIKIYRIPIESKIKKLEPQFDFHFSIIKYYDLDRNISNYSSFLKSFVVFISMEEIDEKLPLIKLFDDKNNSEKVKEMGFILNSLQTDGDTKVFEFDLSSIKTLEATLVKNAGSGAKLKGVYPYIYGELTSTTTNYLNLVQRVAFRYLLIKFIDAHHTTEDINIDVYHTQVSGNYICLSQSFEE